MRVQLKVRQGALQEFRLGVLSATSGGVEEDVSLLAEASGAVKALSRTPSRDRVKCRFATA